MAVTEELRHRIYRRLEELLGHEEASGLMEYLPPVGWADVATKRDLDHLDGRFDRLETRVDRLETRLDRLGDLMVQQTWVLVGAMAGIAAAVVAAAKVL